MAFLKRCNKGYRAKKSKVLTREQIDKFIVNAPDEEFLLNKVVLIFGLAGALRRDEITKMSLDNIDEVGSILVVGVPSTKNDVDRTFTISSNMFFDYIQIYKKYLQLRPELCCHRRLFVNYVNGKCTTQAVGINKIGKIPSQIAEYLNLPDSSSYTGHCFRRSSATLLADSGGDIINIKRHGGWKSSTVAEGYIENSINNKLNIEAKVLIGHATNESHNNSSSSKQHQTKNAKIEHNDSSDEPSNEIIYYTVDQNDVNNNILKDVITHPPTHPIVEQMNTQSSSQHSSSSMSIPEIKISTRNCSNCTITLNITK